MHKKKNNSKKNTSVVILAGGRSERMGFPKLLLPFDENYSFIQFIVESYRKLKMAKIVLVLNEQVWYQHKDYFQQHFSDIEFVINRRSDKDRFFSVQMGLEKINTPFVFIQNTDNPYVKKDLLEEMLSVAPEKGYVSPRYMDKGGHPVLICGSAIETLIHEKSTSILKDVLSKLTRVDLLTDDPDILINIDTQESYEKFFPDFQDKIHAMK